MSVFADSGKSGNLGVAHWDIPIPEFCWTKMKFYSSACPCSLFKLTSEHRRCFHNALCSAKAGPHFSVFSSVSSHFPKPREIFTGTFLAPTAPPQSTEKALIRHFNTWTTSAFSPLFLQNQSGRIPSVGHHMRDTSVHTIPFL